MFLKPAATSPTGWFPADDIRFEVKGTVPAGTAYRVTDWRGQAVCNGTLSGAELKLPKLESGYYRICWNGDEASALGFAVQPGPSSPPGSTATSFALNTNQAYLTHAATGNPHLPASGREAVSGLLGQCSFSDAREFFNWKGIEPVPGKMNWELFDRNFDLLHQAGGENYRLLPRLAPLGALSGWFRRQLRRSGPHSGRSARRLPLLPERGGTLPGQSFRLGVLE
ncbi:MAG: hypothetical protein L6W00_11200 [Lentisphaeria bacterium]|nr:MAG: hypothetical protein L6W00_11200 [Lentisphaeria bacterium]